MLKELKKKRTRLQSVTWVGLPLVTVGGWFYPLLGYLLLGCMVGAVGVAYFRGRAWCDWMCPRGSFFELGLRKLSPNKQLPAFLKKKGFRVFMLSLLFILLGTQVYLAWGDYKGMGLAMVRVLTFTTVAGILLALVYNPRTWCHICPMGTLGNWISTGKQPLSIGDGCASCKACSRVCPMQLKPYEFKNSGVVQDNDCIKCSTCVATCPKKILKFSSDKNVA